MPILNDKYPRQLTITGSAAGRKQPTLARLLTEARQAQPPKPSAPEPHVSRTTAKERAQFGFD